MDPAVNRCAELETDRVWTAAAAVTMLRVEAETAANMAATATGGNAERVQLLSREGTV